MPDKQLRYTAISVIIVVWAIQIVVRLLALSELPGSTVMGVRLLSALAIGATLFVPFRSTRTLWTVGAAALLLSIGVMANSWYFTVGLGGTQQAPVLVNYDSNRWWSDALYHLSDNTGQRAYSCFGYYGYVLAAVMGLAGKTIEVALLWSMTLILIALLLTGQLAYRLSASKGRAALAMVCTAGVCYWLTMGTIVLKDAFVIVAIALAANGLTTRGPKMLAWLIPAAAMLAVSRPAYNLMLVGGVLIVYRPLMFNITSIAAIAVCLLAWQIPLLAGASSDTAKVLAGDASLGVTFNAPNQMAFYNIVGDYTQLPFYKKVLLLPLSAAVQFLIPFPWNFARDIPFGLTQVWAHISYPWYFFGFVVMYFVVSQFKNRFSEVYRLTAWAILCWLVPCYLFGGTISRYGLPFIVPAAPAVATTLINCCKSRRFYTILGFFAVIIVSVLLLAHYLQSSAIA